MTDEDKILGKIFKENLPEAPENPWFVRKVMNRLPQKRLYRSYSWIEWLAFAVAILTLGGYIGYVCYSSYKSQEFTVGDVMMMIISGVVGFVVTVSFFIPAVRQWINET